MRLVRSALKTADTPEGREPAVDSEGPKTIKVAPKPMTQPQSYAKVAAKNIRPRTRPTIKELETPMEKKDKEALGLRALQWKPLKPINRRLVRPGQPLKEGPLKKKVETTKFVYVGGMTRQPFGLVRSALRAVGVDTKKIYDISFIGKQVGSLLTDTEYADTVEKVLTGGKSTMKIIKDFNPLSPDVIKKMPLNGTQKKAPVEIYARRAAFAAYKSKSLLVATKYQQALTDDQSSIFKKELDRLMEPKGEKSKVSPKNISKLTPCGLKCGKTLS